MQICTSRIAIVRLSFNTCSWRWSIFRFVEAFSTFSRKISSIATCSSFDLKQFEQSSFFQAFCTKRLHCVDIVRVHCSDSESPVTSSLWKERSEIAIVSIPQSVRDDQRCIVHTRLRNIIVHEKLFRSRSPNGVRERCTSNCIKLFLFFHKADMTDKFLQTRICSTKEHRVLN